MSNPLQSSDERIVKRESISSDKDGTLEKVWFQPQAKPDGTLTEPWEVRATGRKVNELRGAFKDTAPQMLQEGMKSWEAGGGDLVITKPDGSTDTVRADMESQYRNLPGFCETRVNPGIQVSGFGGMQRDGLKRYRATAGCREYWYTDGRYVKEEL